MNGVLVLKHVVEESKRVHEPSKQKRNVAEMLAMEPKLRLSPVTKIVVQVDMNNYYYYQ